MRIVLMILDGLDDYIDCINNIGGTYNAFTVSSWVNVTSYPNIDFGKIIDIGGNAGRIQMSSSFLDGFEYGIF